ncbi:MAG: carboxypeptidase regulatory-like domain-containing protein [Planctomycetes bacterium]|nr:carboxypeptidase regulatory-like domain-containing protein [Planctomycetota bacterium]
MAETTYRSDAEGRYVVEFPEEQAINPELSIELTTEHKSYANSTVYGSLSIQDGAPPHFFERTAMYDAVPVTGIVLSPEGKPVANVKVRGMSQFRVEGADHQVCLNDTVSGADGRFQLSLPKKGCGIIGVIPKEFGIVEIVLDTKRGELGEIRLAEDNRVRGHVLTPSGKGVPGVPVEIKLTRMTVPLVRYLDPATSPIASYLTRSAITDAKGRFIFDPLPADEYSITFEKDLNDPLATDRTFVPERWILDDQGVIVKDGWDQPPVEIVTKPHVTVSGRLVNGAGQPIRGEAVFLRGLSRRFGENTFGLWQGAAIPDADARFSLVVPVNLEEVRIYVSLNSTFPVAVRYRRGGQDLVANGIEELGIKEIQEDLKDLEVVCYQAPQLRVIAIDAEQKPVTKIAVSARYTNEKLSPVRDGGLVGWDDREGKFCSIRMLPDEEMQVRVYARGYQMATESIRLHEGECRDLVLVMKKLQPGQPDVPRDHDAVVRYLPDKVIDAGDGFTYAKPVEDY